MDSEYQDQPVARVVITTESQSSTSWFVSVIGEVGRFAGRLVKNFLRVYGLGLAFSLGLVAMVYLGLREERWWKEIFGCGILLMGGLIASFFAATKLSIVLSVSETVKVNTVGSRVMRTLFSEAFGITDENPEGNPDVTGSLHGMPVAELKERLHRAGIDLTGNRETSIRLPRLVRWLVAKHRRCWSGRQFGW